MAGTTNVNIVNAPKLTDGIESLDNGLDSIAMHIDNGVNVLSSSITSSVSSCNDISSIFSQFLEAYKTNTDFCSINVLGQIIVSALMSLIASMIVFGVGKWFENKAEKKRKKSEYKNISKGIEVFVNSIEDTVKLQKTNIDSFCESSKSNRYFQLNALEINKICVESLKQYSIQKLTATFVTNRKGDLNEKSKKLYDLINSIDYLSSVHEQMGNYYKEWQTEANKQAELWNDHVKAIHKIHLKLINSSTDREIYYKFYELNQSESNKNEWGPLDWYEKIYSEMRKWCASKKINSSEVTEYEVHLDELCNIYNQGISINLGVSQFLVTYKLHIVEAHNRLKNAITYLNGNAFLDDSEIV